MYSEANDFFGLVKPFSSVGYYETESHRRLYKDLRFFIPAGGIFALTGAVGSGKTTLLNRIQNDLEEKSHLIVSRSLSTEKKALKLSTLFIALFYDLSQKEKNIKVPSQNEKRERELIELMKKNKKPVALFIDEAHDLHGLTLIGLKRLVETVGSKGCTLSIVLAGHPKLGNALDTAVMEEIGTRTKVFNIDEAIGNKEKYIEWLLKNCLNEKVKYQDIITPEAIQKLSSSLVTPLQIQHYLTKALQLGYKIGEKSLTEEMILQVLKPDINSIEAQLVRNGYQFKAICELLNASSKEVSEFLTGKGTGLRKNEFLQKIKSVGIMV